MLVWLGESAEPFTSFEEKGRYLGREPTDPMDSKVWRTSALVAFLAVDEYRTVVGLDNLLRLRSRRVREVLGTAIETRLGTARSASPRHGAESMISGGAAERLIGW